MVITAEEIVSSGITSDEVILSKEEYQEMKFKADSYAIINN